MTLRRAFLDYVGSDEFVSLSADAADAQAALDEVRYCVNLRGDQVRVSRYEHEPDYSADVLATFAKFRQGDVDRHVWRVNEPGGLNHITAQIVDLVARLVPEPFSKLAEFCEAHAGFPETFVVRFDREVQFYVAYLEYMKRFRPQG